MRFMANENVPLASIKRLRAEGHDVSAVVEDAPSIKDDEVMQRAAVQERVLITFDRDYGELVFRRKGPMPAGIVYLRFDPQTPEEPAELMLSLLSLAGLSLVGKFSVVSREQVRQRPLPSWE